LSALDSLTTLVGKSAYSVGGIEGFGDLRFNGNRRRERGKGMRKVTARVLTLALVVVAALMIPGIARANVITWDGSQGLPEGGCPNGAHWVLSGGNLVTENETATLTVDGDAPIDMTAMGHEFQAESSHPVDSSTVVTANYSGDNQQATLKVSGCLAGTTSPPTSPGGGPGTPSTGFNPLPYVAGALLLLMAGTFVLRRRSAQH
jgi:hypothetical protein